LIFSRPVPDPPSPFSLDPLIETWESGRPLIRCHRSDYGATEFNPGKKGNLGRFSPFPDSAGRIVPYLYCADSAYGAISETVFHDVPVRGPGRAVSRARLLPMLISTLAPRKTLILAQLHGFGLRRLQVSRAELIESEADQYERTAAWARALHTCRTDLHGLVWMSRQHDPSRALMLFGDRLLREDLEIAEAPLPLYNGSGLERLQIAADLADIAIFD
jgi:hypothetical protein